MNKLALVTGGAKRIGKAIVLELAKQGYDIIIHYNKSDEAVNNLHASLQEHYPYQQFFLSRFDLSQWKEAGDYMQQCMVHFGIPTLIIHNASNYAASTISETEEALMERMMGIHYLSPFFMSKAWANITEGGQIIGMVDTQIKTYNNTHAAYLASKKSLADFIKTAAKEWAPKIRVNGIAPGPVLPPPQANEEHLKKVVEQTPLKQQVPLEAITSSINYLINNEIMTGQILYCDSGQHLC